MRSFLKTKLPRYSIRKIGTVAVSVMTAMSVFTPSIAQASTGDGSNSNSGSTVTQNTDNSSNDQQTTGKGTGTGNTGTGKGKGTGKPDDNVNDNADALKASENNEKRSETETPKANSIAKDEVATESMNVSDPSSHIQVSADMIGASEVVTDGSQLSKSNDSVYQQAMKDKADKEKNTSSVKKNPSSTQNKKIDDSNFKGMHKDETKAIDKRGNETTVGKIAENLEKHNVLGIAAGFGVFSDGLEIQGDSSANFATNHLKEIVECGTRHSNAHNNSDVDVYYIGDFGKEGNGSPNAFRNDSHNRLVLGDKAYSRVTTNKDGQVFFDNQRNDKLNINGKDTLLHQEDYINISKELQELGRRSDLFMNHKDNSKGVNEILNVDQNNRYIDVSKAIPENGIVYINLDASYLTNGPKILVKGIDNTVFHPQIVINIINAKNKTVNVGGQMPIEYRDGHSFGSGGDEDHGDYQNSILWNFGTDVTQVSFSNGFVLGSVLAPNAHIIANENVNGTIVGDYVEIKGENHRWDGNTEVPSFPYIPKGGEEVVVPPKHPTSGDGNNGDQSKGNDHKQSSTPSKDHHDDDNIPPKGDDHKKPSTPSKDHHDDDNIPPKGDDHKKPSTPSEDHHDNSNIPPKGDKPKIPSNNHHDNNNIPPKSDNPTVPTNNTDVPQTPSNDVPPKADIPTTPLTPSDDDDFYPSLNKSQKNPSAPATFAPLSKQSFKKNKSNTKKNSKMTYFAAQSKNTLNGKQRKTEFNDLTVREAKKSEDNTIDLMAKKSEKSTNLPKQTVPKHQAALPQTGAKKGFAIAVLGMALTVLSFGLIKLSKREN